MLLTPSLSGDWTANRRSQAPVFSADGQTLAFSSYASDLLDYDFNHGNDVFVLKLGSSPITDSDGDGMSDADELVAGRNAVRGLHRCNPHPECAMVGRC
jgi:hypothetical protein